MKENKLPVWVTDQKKEENKPFSGNKHDQERPRFDLIPPLALTEVAIVFKKGAEKYADFNWMGLEKHRLLRASLSHIIALLSGERNAPEFQTHHAAHAICSLMMMLELDILKPEDPILQTQEIYDNYRRSKQAAESGNQS